MWRNERGQMASAPSTVPAVSSATTGRLTMEELKMCKDVVIKEDTRAVAPVSEQTISDYLAAFGMTTQLSKQETLQFVEVAKAFNLNPFKREIYAVPHTGKDGKRSLTIITGYEVYLKRADHNPAFDGYTTEFDTKNGDVVCTCTVYRKDRRIPTAQTVSMREYDTGRSLWASKPRVMLEKVAIATAFRRAFPNDFGGMPYTKEELPEDMTREPRDVTPESAPEPAPEPQNNIAKPTQEQVDKLNALKTAFTDQELAEFKVKYRGNIPAMIKAMSKARIAKFDAGTLHRAAEPEPAPEPQKHKWATPEQRAALEQMEQEKPEPAKQTVGEPAPDMFQDDSAELYGDDPLANDKAHREEMF